MTKSLPCLKDNIESIDETNLEYEVKRREIKYPRVELRTGKLVLILPMDFKDENELLNKKSKWIHQKKKIIEDAVKRVSEDMDLNVFLLFGEKFQIEKSSEVSLDLENKILKIDTSDKRHVDKLKNIMRSLLKEKIEHLIEDYSKKLKVKPNKILIKQQKTKWASCSPRRNLSFNLKLIALPEEILRYVVYHEMTHLRERKHNDNFWRIIEKEFKNYSEMEKRLLEYWFYLEKLPIYSSDYEKKRKSDPSMISR